ncbi:ATP-dependent DNA helicase [Polaromonas sp.]|uniref:ATP-dependent DNA helicase n=1 Tax=Polaromonas sp. TaxID=1869339 RepID=UPI003BA9183B
MKYLVAVRALCEFTAKHGDLDLRFTPAPSAQEGMAGHAVVASRRGDGYQAEVSLEGEYKNLRVRGRADGYDPALNRLEEVKTFRGDLHAMPDNRRNLHWAQAKIYGWLLCHEKGLENINLSLVYFDIASLQETPLTEHFSAASLKEYFELQCERFLLWADQELAHRLARDAALTALDFPHASFRPGQRELAEAVYKTSSAGKCLMAQATTGIGKTVGTVFPLLKATPKKKLDKLFFLAAKTPGRKLALDALALIKDSAGGLPLRVLELVARDKSCEHLDKACHGDACPLARGFYDRLPQARVAAVHYTASEGMLDKAALRKVALTHHVCPYYLSQELVTWSDVAVGDYNYFFDSSALLYNMTLTNQWRVSVLVDEAHNMIERARKMYSATLEQAQLHQVHASAPRAVRGALERLNRNFNDLHKLQTEPYQVHAELPASFLKALQQAITGITDFLVANPTRVDGELQAFYFEALHFSRMADAFGAHSIFDITLNDSAQTEASAFQGDHGCATLNIRNVVPAPFLAPRFAAANSVALFSATLSPQDFYRETLGLPAGAAWVDVQSPFTHEQLRVAAVSNISTRYQHRDQSLGPIADLMARQYGNTPGNYLAFLSSYDYLQKLVALFRERYPHIPVWEQKRQMDEAGREQFLARFTPDSQGIGFAVLGGAFAEGVDLPGRRLIGAFVATLGLPQVNPVNEEIRKRMGAYFDGKADSKTDGSGELGYNYTYLYPGLQKVVQAAGRVIRTQLDVGVIYLMDDRFTRPEVLELLPPWWKVERLYATRTRKVPSPGPKIALATSVSDAN